MGDVILVVSFVAPLVIAGLVVIFVFRGQRRQLERAERDAAALAARIQAASPATASVLRCEVARQHEGSGEILVDLLLQIERPGEPRRTTKTRWEMNAAALPSVQPGQVISIKIDAAEPDRIYPQGPWAEYWPHVG